MKRNKILERIERGEKAIGISLSGTLESAEVVEMCGRLGLDYVNFDGQHSSMTPETIGRMAYVAEANGLTVGMRIPDHQPSTLVNYLDRGVMQVTAPDLETADQARALVAACYYAPEGKRSCCSFRFGEYGLGEDLTTLMADCNAKTMIVPQLESITAFNNLDEILEVPGIDLFGWGPQDLAQSLGHPGEPNHPECVKAQEIAEEKIRKAGKGLLSDHTESINTLYLIKEAALELLDKHGRSVKSGPMTA